MSHRAIRWVIEQTDLQGSDFAVLIALSYRADRLTDQCYPSLAKLADDAHVSVSTVQRSLQRLEDQGFIQIARKAGPSFKDRGDRRPHLYTVLVEERQVTYDQSVPERLVNSEPTTGHDSADDWSTVTTEQSSIEPSVIEPGNFDFSALRETLGRLRSPHAAT